MRGKANRDARKLIARPVIAGGVYTILERFGPYAVRGFFISLGIPTASNACLHHGVRKCDRTGVPEKLGSPRFSDAMAQLFGGAAGLALGAISESCFMPRAVYG